MTIQPVSQAISPLRRRLTDDMTLRQLSPLTKRAYVHGVKGFGDFVGHWRSRDMLTFQGHKA